MAGPRSFLATSLYFAAALAAVSASSPAAEIVAAEDKPYFEFERVQLTPTALERLGSDAELFAFDNGAHTLASRANGSSCKVFPGDASWPSDATWQTLNGALGKDALIKTVPLAAPCYYSWGEYQHDKCAALTANWTDSYLHMADPTSMMSPVYQGLTCQVTTDPTQSCTLGGYPSYAINVSTVAQIQLGINFARNTGIRLVIKNTGHDFSGKSGGAGALSLWTHNLKDVQFIDKYSAKGSNHSGPAVKAGSGVQAFEIYEEASKKGLVVVGGEGQTVGVMGGYVQGGGHSPLSSLFGLAADQVLSAEVVTPDGQFVTADFEQNTDLFWAIRGGGGSTFGVVSSITVKAHPDMQVTASTFSFSVGGNITYENFWTGVRNYLDYFPSLTSQGIYAYWFITTSTTGATFLMQPFWAPGKTLDETNALLAPWFAQLAALNITFTPKTVHYDSFYPGWLASFPLEVIEKTHVATGSRLFPKQNWESKSSLDATFNAIKSSVDAGLIIIAFIIDPSLKNGGYPDNSANPAWRNTYSHVIQSINWPEGASVEVQWEARHNLTDVHMQQFRDVSPGAGSYLAESDILEPNFQQAFYGTFYPRLLEIKKKIDPGDVLFAQNAVGSEFWKVITANGLPSGDGRLCRA